MGSESLPAMSAEQFYVSASRGRERAMIYTDLAPAALRQAIQRQDTRKSATELLHPKTRRKAKGRYREKAGAMVKHVKETYRRLRDQVGQAMGEVLRQQERERGYAR